VLHGVLLLFIPGSNFRAPEFSPPFLSHLVCVGYIMHNVHQALGRKDNLLNCSVARQLL
jgi:hypothetical protein